MSKKRTNYQQGVNFKALLLLNKTVEDVYDERIKNLEKIKYKLDELNRGYIV